MTQLVPNPKCIRCGKVIDMIEVRNGMTDAGINKDVATAIAALAAMFGHTGGRLYCPSCWETTYNEE